MVSISRENRGVNVNLAESLESSLMNFTNEESSCTENVSTSTDIQGNLYKLKTGDTRKTPTKLEFKLYQNKMKTRKIKTFRKSPKESQRNLLNLEENLPININVDPKKNLFSKMKNAFSSIADQKLGLSPKGGNPRKTQIDIYYFDRGNAEFLRTTDGTPAVYSESLLNQTEYYANRVWAEIFGSLQIGVTFFISFVLQLYRFILYSLFRVLIVGFLQITSDYCLKPIMTVLFNGFLQPPLIFAFNVMASIQDVLNPVAQTINNFLFPLINVLKSIRLVNVNRFPTTFQIKDEVV